jgi:hypothetical protein
LGVIVGKYSWIGYINYHGIENSGLPKIRKGVYPPINTSLSKETSGETIEKINILYAKNYSVANDFLLMWGHLFGKK